MTKAQDRDQFAMAGIRSEADGTPRWHLEKTDCVVNTRIHAQYCIFPDQTAGTTQDLLNRHAFTHSYDQMVNTKNIIFITCVLADRIIFL